MAKGKKIRISEYFGGPESIKSQDNIYRGACYFAGIAVLIMASVSIILSSQHQTRINTLRDTLITGKTVETCYPDLSENSTISSNFTHIPEQLRTICECVSDNNSTNNSTTQQVKSICICYYLNLGCSSNDTILYCDEDSLLKQLCDT